jgi:hypothetical protein
MLDSWKKKKVHWKMSLQVISEIKNSNSPALFEFQTDGGKKGINGDDDEYI